MTHRIPLIGALAVTLLVSTITYGQPGSSDFDPQIELRRVKEMPTSHHRVRRMFYLGDLASRSGSEDVARQAYREALLSYRDLDGNQAAVALPYAAQSALSLAGHRHLEFRSAPLRWEYYQADSSARIELLASARNEYNVVASLGFPRATFEALYLRAYLLEEWETNAFDAIAEENPEIPALERAVRHIDLTRQLNERARDEYRHLIDLEDSLGLVGGRGDDNVRRWIDLAHERIAGIDAVRDTLRAREEALQAVYAERKALRWVDRAVPLLWERVDSLAAVRDAGSADPFVDFWLQTQLVEQAFRPFLFGETGFYTVQQASAESARVVRDDNWLNERLTWQREIEWLDTGIARKLARAGIEQLDRATGELNNLVDGLTTQADSIPSEWRRALRGIPSEPRISMPPIPTFGGRDPRLLVGEEKAEVVDEYERFLAQMAEVSEVIATYEDSVALFTTIATDVTATDLPSETEEYLRIRRGLTAATTLLLDTLATRVIEQAQDALEVSRNSAVWLPDGPLSITARETIRDYRNATSASLEQISQDAAAEANRHRLAARRLGQNPPSCERVELADALDAFADRLRSAAYDLAPFGSARSELSR